MAAADALSAVPESVAQVWSSPAPLACPPRVPESARARPAIELRTNWAVYAEEFAVGAVALRGIRSDQDQVGADDATADIAPFESKYLKRTAVCARARSPGRERSVILELVTIVLGGVLLYGGGEAVVRGGTAIGLQLGLSPVVVGLTIVAFGTSAPELAVSVGAALGGHGDLAIANVVGSNLANIALVLGISALMVPLGVESRLVAVDIPLAFFAVVALGLLASRRYARSLRRRRVRACPVLLARRIDRRPAARARSGERRFR